MVKNGGRRIRAKLGGEAQRLFTDHVVGAVAHLEHRVGVHARPRLDGGVDIQGLVLGAEADQVEAGDIDRQVQDQVASLDVLAEDAAMGFRREVRMLEARAALPGQPPALFVCRQHQQATFALERDVTANQRQDALADAPATNDDDLACEVDLRHVSPDSSG